jgi:Ca2+-binding RTX toxin-like protein
MFRALLVLTAIPIWVSGAASASGPPGTCGGRTVTIVGTAGDDRLTGTPGDDVVDLGEGDDGFDGTGAFRGGDDRVCGGPGDDVIRTVDAVLVDGGAGRDSVYWSGGNGTVLLGPGSRDVVQVKAGRPTVRDAFGTLFLRVSGRAAPDVHARRSLAVFLNLSYRSVPAEVDLSTGEVLGGGVDFRIRTRSLRGVMGTRFADVLRGDALSERIEGGLGDDLILGLGGDDSLQGGEGDDRLRGGSGTDYIDGDQGRDLADGGPGPDRCFAERRTRC